MSSEPNCNDPSTPPESQPNRSPWTPLRIGGVAASVVLVVGLGITAWMSRAVVNRPAPREPAKGEADLALLELRSLEPESDASPAPMGLLLAAVSDEIPVAGEAVVRKPVEPPRVVKDQPKPAQPEKFVMKRRNQASEEDLRKQLLKAPDLAVDNPKASTAQSTKLVQMARQLKAGESLHFTPSVLNKRPDLSGLPFRTGAASQLGKEPAENLHVQSQKLRTVLDEAIVGGKVPGGGVPFIRLGGFAGFGGTAGDPRLPSERIRSKLRTENELKDDFQSEGAIPCLMQMLMPENSPIRKVLVGELAHIEHRRASEALAQLAVFDLSEDVRADAVKALAKRPREQYRHVLLAGLRHIWAPAADHAAEALATLQDRETVSDLRKLLDESDPTAPSFSESDKAWRVPELVRINHLRNCLMCHPFSKSANDLVRGRVPPPGQPLTPGFVAGYSGQSSDTFIRADITFLRQEFSVFQPVDNPGTWPNTQRYDYMVRMRRVKTDAELATLEKKAGASYPQREAVQFALSELER